jgi:hypothetical protein
MAEIILEPTGSSDFERCECCGKRSRTVWGLARRDGDADAAYFVHWTLGQLASDGAHFDLILGRWGEDATPLTATRYPWSTAAPIADRLSW